MSTFKSIAVCLLVVCGTSAQAATISQTETIRTTAQTEGHSTTERYGFSQPRTTTESSTAEVHWSGDKAAFDLFDATLGTLTGVTVTHRYSFGATAAHGDDCVTRRIPTVQRKCSNATSSVGRLDAGLDFSNLSPSVPVISPGVNAVTDILSHSVSYSNAAGGGTTNNIGTGAFTTVTSLTNASTLAAFTGTGTYDVNFSTYWFETVTTTCSGDPIYAFGQLVGYRDIETCFVQGGLSFNDRSVRVTVAYTYDEPVVVVSPVPLPAGGVLLLTALGGLVLRRARTA